MTSVKDIAQEAVNKVANGLSIPREMRQREVACLSGGEKTRVNLGRLILEDTDILLLDEPTNHLDQGDRLTSRTYKNRAPHSRARFSCCFSPRFWYTYSRYNTGQLSLPLDGGDAWRR